MKTEKSAKSKMFLFYNMRKENIFYGGSLEITLIVPLRLNNVDTDNFFDCVNYLNIF